MNPHVNLKIIVDDEGVQTHQLCCLCMDYIPVDELYVDDDGDKWDVCRKCNLAEQIRAQAKAKEDWDRGQQRREA